MKPNNNLFLSDKYEVIDENTGEYDDEFIDIVETIKTLLERKIIDEKEAGALLRLYVDKNSSRIISETVEWVLGRGKRRSQTDVVLMGYSD